MKTEKITMKFFSTIAFVLVIGSINALPTATDESDLADKVKKVIDNILDFLPEKLGLTDIGYVIPDNDFIKGSLNIDEISISRFNSPDIEIVSYDNGTSRLDYELNFKNVQAIVDFTVVLDGFIELGHHFSAVIDLLDLNGQGDAIISQDPKEVTDFQILVSVGNIDAVIKGLLNDDEFSEQVSEDISLNGAQEVNAILFRIAPSMSSFINDIINLIIKFAN